MREHVGKLREGGIPDRGAVAGVCQTEAVGKALRAGALWTGPGLAGSDKGRPEGKMPSCAAGRSKGSLR